MNFSGACLRIVPLVVMVATAAAMFTTVIFDCLFVTNYFRTADIWSTSPGSGRAVSLYP